jgi:S-adenosylmethionine:tRNA ribosyltransferase-isomerase
MKPATSPGNPAKQGKLLVIDEHGCVSHHARDEFPSFVRRHDLVVANDAATLPASLSGIHVSTGAAVEVRLAARASLAPPQVTRFTAVLFGAGDFRTPTEHRPPPPTVRTGDELQLGPLRAVVAAVGRHPRLLDLVFEGSATRVWEGLARHGRPIQYSYVPEPLAIWDTWTRIAGQPVAFEAPSAGFFLTWTMIHELRTRGARLATITHAAGVSSTGDADLDALLPLDEPYFIPSATASRIDETKRRGGRVIAIGTTVVRALEHAVRPDGGVTSGEGIATERIGLSTPLRVVDAIVSGVHERGSSHYELLRAFQTEVVLGKMDAEAEARSYLTHEFGDSVFIAVHRKAAEPRQRLQRLSSSIAGVMCLS